MNRRLFLVQSATGLFLVACGDSDPEPGPTGPLLDDDDRDVVCVDEVLLTVSALPAVLARIGDLYLLDHPDENNGELLVDAVFDAGGGPGGLTEALRATIQQEYTLEDVVSVDGWRLARTEARLAALVGLAQQC